ncbi:PREDICTED: methylecgonone reductase-like [Fragaria vesca subsp. vesca]|uniref:methylecgonone reductase-like n=1 Tax=Fragaria vesca subsp. vesca TaxID=101020 RepID=UPI0002C301DB|nr:PREDICTED: methylecgonone reductase-like [Fragaria vesca subsp. vesca]
MDARGKKAVVIPEVVLSSGKKMPVLGFGTGVFGKTPPAQTLALILLDAIELGYRHFDTAALYGTEEAVGLAVAQALERGLVKSRDEFFITSKLWCPDAHHDLVLPALKSTLQRLGLEYVDLYLIHWPVRMKPGTTGVPTSKDVLLPFDIMGTWEAMEECSRLGLAKSIGVSNFGTKKLSQILDNGTIPPAVNQVEMNPSWQQEKLRDYCKGKGIHVTAWSPLGFYGAAAWATKPLIDYAIIKDIAAAKGKSVAQVILRSIIQQGDVSAISRSFNKERMKDNAQIFDWELTEDEMNKIKEIPQRRLNAGDFFVSEDGQYKSLDDLWDGNP